MVKTQKGDYVIIETDKQRYLFAKVRASDADGVKVVIEQSEVEGKRVDSMYAPEQILFNLGTKPKFGRVYGQLIEPLRKTQELPEWGELHVYRKLDKAEKKALKLALAHVMKDLKKHGVAKFLPITIELRNKAGRWSGFYKQSSRYQNENGHLMVLGPKEYQFGPLVELIRHESAHAVWFQLMTNKQRLRWVKLYTHYLTLKQAGLKTIGRLRKELEDSRDLHAFKASLKDSEDDTLYEVFNECVAHVRSTFNLDNEDFELLVESGESLKPYWPRHEFDLSESSKGEAVMTEYGMTKPAEFFAEAFRLYLEGKSGKTIRKLMKKTLANLK